ncbi:MAG: FCD domain-containing protein, partial [Cyanobacteria bacterium J06639_1]
VTFEMEFSRHSSILNVSGVSYTDLVLEEADFQALESLLKSADRAIANGEQILGRSLGEEFHRYLANKVGNQRLRSHIEQMQEHVDRVRPLIWQKGLAPIERSAQQHWQIFHALKRGDAHKAEALMTEHTIWFEAELAAALQYAY